METIIAAILSSLIGGSLALVGVIITNNNSNKKAQAQNEKNQAVMGAKLEELTREVREHNNFAKRMPVVEEQIKAANARLKKLEKFHEPRG